MILADDADAALVRRVNAMLYLAHRHPRSPGYYRDVGEALAELRAARKGIWPEIVKLYCHLGRRRAYQLIELATIGKTLDELRHENAARVRKHRKGKWLAIKTRRRKRPKRPDSA
jgi:hypothetical protein